MRVVVYADAEGAARIADYRECFPAFGQYWQTGRDRLTDDVVAAAEGLLAGGATSVTVIDGHGPGTWANVVASRLPPRVSLIDGSVGAGDFDAAFHVGFHARCGTRDGFMSHTHVPEFRVKVNGSLITENHSAAWTAGVPVLGITGDQSLQHQLDGVLTGTPFLAVKRSTSRTDTVGLHHGSGDSSAAISAFAQDCLREAGQRRLPHLPDGFEVAISMSPDLIDDALERSGLQRTSAAVLTTRGSDWARDIRPKIGIAAQAASRPLDAALAELDLSAGDALPDQEPTRLQNLRDLISSWMQTAHAEWQD